MIASTHCHAILRACVRTALLACACLLVPLTSLQAQKTDYAAVGRRLKAAVAAGELTGDQAIAMWGALRKTSNNKDQGSARAKVYLAKVKKELGALLQADRITKEQAAKRYADAVKAIQARMGSRSTGKRATSKKSKQPDREREYLENVRKKLGQAVKSGKMSRREASKKFADVKKGLQKKKAASKRRTKASGKKRTKAIGKKKRDSLKQIEIDLGKIQRAIKTGRLSTRDAELKMRSMRKRMTALERSSK